MPINLKTKDKKNELRWWGDNAKTIKERNIPVQDCKCGEGRFLPTKNIDRCPRCMFIKNHS